MRRLVLVMCCLCCFTGMSSAARVELFGGGQYTHLDPSFNLVGWNLAATVNAGRFFGDRGLQRRL
jgi:hypothetical protein